MKQYRKKILVLLAVMIICGIKGEKKTYADTIYHKNDCPIGYHIIKKEKEQCKHNQKDITAWIEASPESTMQPDFLEKNPTEFLKWCHWKEKKEHPFEVKFLIQDAQVIGESYGKIISSKKVSAVINERADSMWDIAFPAQKEHENHEIVANFACVKYGFGWCEKSGRWERLWAEHTYLYDAKLDRDVEHDTYPSMTHGVTKYEIEPNSYQIQYMPNGAEGEQKVQNAVYGKIFKLEKKIFKRKKYKFMGWTEQKDGGGKCYKSGQSVRNLTDKENGCITLYACWKPIYTVKYRLNADGQKGEIPKKQKKTGEEPLILTLHTPVLENTDYKKAYRFLGWSDTPDGRNGLWTEEIYERESDLTLYAQWDTSYCVQYDGNGAQEGQAYMDVINSVKETYVVRKNKENLKFKKKDKYEDTKRTVACKFMGWSLKKETSQWQEKDRIKEGKEFIKGKLFKVALKKNAIDFEQGRPKLTLYAIWDQKPQIDAVDRYFTLEEARNGAITEEELRKGVSAVDREDGIFEGKQIKLIDYKKQDFTALHHDAVISVEYQVVDRVGNTAKIRKNVYIIDQRADRKGELAREVLQKIRFLPLESSVKKIKEQLSEKSLWKCNDEYKEQLQKGLQDQKKESTEIENSENKLIWNITEERKRRIKQILKNKNAMENRREAWKKIIEECENGIQKQEK